MGPSCLVVISLLVLKPINRTWIQKTNKMLHESSQRNSIRFGRYVFGSSVFAVDADKREPELNRNRTDSGKDDEIKLESPTRDINGRSAGEWFFSFHRVPGSE
jgi:hypothetical protein